MRNYDLGKNGYSNFGGKLLCAKGGKIIKAAADEAFAKLCYDVQPNDKSA